MLTKLLYQTDSYLTKFQARVEGIDPDTRGVVLDQTAFYPGGGGQPADDGTLLAGGVRFPVIRAQKTPMGVMHLLGGENILPAVGAEVEGELDWDRRYKLMRTHTAMHILCGVVFRDFGALVTGGDMEPLRGRMDFEFETLQKELIQVIEAAVNKEIQMKRDLRVAILPRQEAFQIPDLIRTKINLLPEGITEVRVVEIQGLDLQADGGTHVHNTAEVGTMRIADYKSKGKINKRIYVDVLPG
jgi:misacylated tRNA(Ala) deacylase